jgi:hypothetical protein
MTRDLTSKDLERDILAMARAAGFASVRDAYARLDRGELRGTMIEMHLEMLRFLKGARKPR